MMEHSIKSKTYQAKVTDSVHDLLSFLNIKKSILPHTSLVEPSLAQTRFTTISQNQKQSNNKNNNRNENNRINQMKIQKIETAKNKLPLCDLFKTSSSKAGAMQIKTGINQLKKSDFRITTKVQNKTRWFRFRPFIDDMNGIIPVIDKGYYYKFLNGEIKIIKCTLEDNGFSDKGKEWCVLWNIGPIKNDIYSNLQFFQKVNHFPRSHEITRKDYMHRNITKMQIKHGLSQFNFVPKTFLIPNDMDLLKMDHEKSGGTRWYIAKPPASSQGKGIFVSDNIADLYSISQSTVVSHYVHNPLLIDGLKFDMRIYVAVTSVDPLMIYIYDEGLARFATEPYDLNHPENKYDRFMHLTNFSLNNYSSKFKIYEDKEDEGNKWTLTALKKLMENSGIDSNAAFTKIEDIIIKSILSIEDTLFSNCELYVPFKNNCFELFGFDIMIDQFLNPWLLEINLSPSMACESWLDQKIKSHLLADLFSLSGILPLDQRKLDDFLVNKNFNIYLKEGTNYPKTVSANLMTPEMIESRLCEHVLEEIKRCGRFKLIYPSYNVGDYKNFFEKDRASNTILRETILKNLKNLTQQIKTRTKIRQKLIGQMSLLIIILLINLQIY